jgi:uncharacterized protein (DUF4415 family)
MLIATKKLGGSVEWSDPDDAPELTDEMLNQAEVFEGDAFVRRGRGRPKSDAAKVLISVRLDADLVAELRSAGPGWQSRIGGLLREALGKRGESLLLAEQPGELNCPSEKVCFATAWEGGGPE